MKMKAYKFRLYPNEQQIEYFHKCFGSVRFIYNQMLSERIALYKSGDKTTRYKTPAAYKSSFLWLREIDSLALCNAQLNLDKAYANFFRDPKHVGFPKFKKKSLRPWTYTTNNQNNSICIIDNKIKLPKLRTLVNIRIHRQVKGLIKSVTISQRANDKFYISILAQEEITELSKTNLQIGIDLGIADFAILSDGTKIANPHFSNQLEKKLAREKRKLSHRFLIAKKMTQKYKDKTFDSCMNYRKQKIKVARIYEKINNRKSDFIHKLSTKIVENQDIICIEDLNVSGLLKNHKLAKSIADVSWSEFVRQLQYKCDWYGKKLIKIGRFFPSSQICSECGYSSGKKALDIREWTCSNCGTHHDRDINAARNILNRAIA